MLQKSAIIDVRKRLKIPQNGFSSEDNALDWYKKHYRKAKDEGFYGNFGFHYDCQTGYVDLQYEIGQDSLTTYAGHPLDSEIPLDKEAIQLAKDANLPDWATPCIRLLILIGELPQNVEIILPKYLMAPVGNLKLLIHPEKTTTTREWRKTGEMMGLLPGKVNLLKIPGVNIVYSPKRRNRMEPLYWHVLLAYAEAAGLRKERKQKGKRGLLIETANLLKKEYSWQDNPDSYVVRRYLDRA
ncbi:hypothetical protein ACFLUH_04310, partial [Chloroflexota bacterium]